MGPAGAPHSFLLSTAAGRNGVVALGQLAQHGCRLLEQPIGVNAALPAKFVVWLTLAGPSSPGASHPDAQPGHENYLVGLRHLRGREMNLHHRRSGGSMNPKE